LPFSVRHILSCLFTISNSLLVSHVTFSIPSQIISGRELRDLRVHNNQVKGVLGPTVGADATDEELEQFCSAVWPQRVTFKAQCLQFFETDNPPVRCDCCTDCV